MDFITQVFKWLGFGRYWTSPPTLANGDVGELQLDSSGRLKVVVDAYKAGLLAPTPTTLWSQVAGVAQSQVVKAAPGKMWSIVAHNESSSTRYFMVFDSTTLPADGAVPQISFKMRGNESLVVFFPRALTLSVGIVWCFSDDPEDKKISVVDPGIARLEYE